MSDKTEKPDYSALQSICFFPVFPKQELDRALSSHAYFGLVFEAKSASIFAKITFIFQLYRCRYKLANLGLTLKNQFAIFPDTNNAHIIYQLNSNAENYSQSALLSVPTAYFKQKVSNIFRYLFGIHYSISCILFEVENHEISRRHI